MKRLAYKTEETISNRATGYARCVFLIYVSVGLGRDSKRLGGGYRGLGSPEQDN